MNCTKPEQKHECSIHQTLFSLNFLTCNKIKTLTKKETHKRGVHKFRLVNAIKLTALMCFFFFFILFFIAIFALNNFGPWVPQNLAFGGSLSHYRYSVVEKKVMMIFFIAATCKVRCVMCPIGIIITTQDKQNKPQWNGKRWWSRGQDVLNFCVFFLKVQRVLRCTILRWCQTLALSHMNSINKFVILTGLIARSTSGAIQMIHTLSIIEILIPWFSVKFFIGKLRQHFIAYWMNGEKKPFEFWE